ncbi:hypothetical protein SLEP1_g53269 [Rubroshorea leprosula]|uniref:Uncharacterized protein n=1 Tax=Rubroshorea leprosula TaxID=152421 RepID=A0AAV5M924_9ROSI|nr:hypothetical protein SLEP1_g53269 [Rubroshorea leprosula]
MASFHDAQEFRGNQGEDEEVDVISVEPIAMIVPPELQDSPRTTMPESSPSSSVGGGSESHRSSTSCDSPTEETPSGAEGVEEVGCNAPVTSAAVEVAVFEGWESKVLSGQLDNLCKAPKTLPAGFKFKAVLHHEVADDAATVKGYKKLEEMVGDVCKGGGFQVTLLVPAVSLHQRYEMLTIGDVELKNRLLNYVKARGLVDLEALVTPEQIALRGFVDVANLHSQGNVSELKAQGAKELGLVPIVSPALTSGHLLHRGTALSTRVPARHRGRVSSNEQSLCPQAQEGACGRTPMQRTTFHSSGGGQVLACSPPLLPLCDLPACPKRQFARLLRPHQPRRYAELCAPCRPAACKGARLAAWRTCCFNKANGCVQLHYRTLRVEKDTSIQAAKEELSHAEERARKAESEREKTLHELSALRERAFKADQHVARAEASLESTKRLHQRDICFARAQGAEWLVGAEMFQDAVAIASANTTTDIFNEVQGMVLQVRADFPIGELAFFEGEEINAEGKSLAQPSDTWVRLRWELNEEGLPVWPPSVIEEGEDTEGLPSFEAWVANPHDVPVEPSSTPPSAQPQPQPAAVAVSAPSPPDRPSPARSTSEPNNASISIDLTDD